MFDDPQCTQARSAQDHGFKARPPPLRVYAVLSRLRVTHEARVACSDFILDREQTLSTRVHQFG